MSGPVRNADPIHDGCDPMLALACRHIVVQQRKLDIFGDREFVDQVEALKDESDIVLTQMRELHSL